jgi:tungstate transport system substrate-binding protein
MGAEGNADVLLTHAPQAEQALIDSGAVDRRIEFMENYFVLAGPKEDPARVAEAPGVLAALKLIRESGASFVSRGDDSGTHKREVALLRAAGLDPSERFPGLTRTGSGMGLSLQVAGQKSAYILSDIGTFLAFREHIGLVALTREEPALKNIYAVLRVSPERFPRVHAKEASRLADFLRGDAARALIRSFGIDRFGRPLFKPLEPTDE